MVCAKPSRYFARLPVFAPRKNHSESSSGDSVGRSLYFASFASSITVFGRSTPSKCSCKRTLGNVRSISLSGFMELGAALSLASGQPGSKTLQDHTPVVDQVFSGLPSHAQVLSGLLAGRRALAYSTRLCHSANFACSSLSV